MASIPDKSVDMVLTDLPYGCLHIDWDINIDLKELFRQLTRVCKENAAMVFTANMKLGYKLISISPKLFRYDLVWEKNTITGMPNCNVMPMRSHELILIFYQKKPTYNPQKTGEKVDGGKRKVKIIKEDHWYQGLNPIKKVTDYIDDGTRFPKSIIKIDRDNIQFNCVNGKQKGASLHPTQKPVSLFSWLIRTYTNPGETVLDCCMGSGTTAIACLQEGRNYLGFETDPGYWEKSQQRINNFKETPTTTPTTTQPLLIPNP
jgi:site-specific DNA-methyltransferase (adenine-specific)